MLHMLPSCPIAYGRATPGALVEGKATIVAILLFAKQLTRTATTCHLIFVRRRFDKHNRCTCFKMG